jgi:hypothetical protein
MPESVVILPAKALQTKKVMTQAQRRLKMRRGLVWAQPPKNFFGHLETIKERKKW